MEATCRSRSAYRQAEPVRSRLRWATPSSRPRWPRASTTRMAAGRETADACKSRLIAPGDVEMIALNSEFAADRGGEGRGPDPGLPRPCRGTTARSAWLEEEGRSSGHPSCAGLTCTVTAIEPLTPEIHRLCLRIESGGPFSFTPPGPPPQYAAVRIRRPSAARLFHGRPAGRRPARVSHPATWAMARRPTWPTASRSATGCGSRGRTAPPIGAKGHRGRNPGDCRRAPGWRGRRDRRGGAGGRWRAQPIHLYKIGARDERDLYGVEAFEALAAAHPNLTVVPVLSEPSGPTDRRTGLCRSVRVPGAGRGQKRGRGSGISRTLTAPRPIWPARRRWSRRPCRCLEAKGLRRRRTTMPTPSYTEADKAALEAAP